MQILGPEAVSGFRGETRNLSSGGVLFTTPPLPLTPGDPIEYMITLSLASGTLDSVRIHCMGKLVRKDEPTSFAATLERYEFLRRSE
jgi:hypothetical protein